MANSSLDTLRVFSEKELAYYRYQARQNLLREQRSIQRHTEALEADLGQALGTIADERQFFASGYNYSWQ